MINFKSISEYEGNSPHSPENGIRLINPQGRIGMTWWSQRWLSLIDSMAGRTAIEQGRRYARRAQIVGFEIGSGTVTAEVMGSVDMPYVATIGWPAIPDATWKGLRGDMLASMEYLAELMASIMPRLLEDLFAKYDYRLFPERLADLELSCTCGEETLPCKHLAAALFLFADRMDDDPFRWLQFRGCGRDIILGDLFAKWGNTPEPDEEDEEEELTVHRLPVQSFWSLNEELSEIYLPATAGSASVNVIKRLGFPPFFPQGDRTVMQTLEGLYED